MYFTTMYVVLGKSFSFYEYGEEAHVYRGYAARAFGWLEPSDEEALAELERVSPNSWYADYERTIAQRGLERFRKGNTR